MTIKGALFSAYVALSGTFWADSKPAVYKPGVCVLAAPKHIPLGTKVEVSFPKGKVICTVRDRIGKPKERYHFDLMVADRKTAIRFGLRRYTVRIL